MKGIAVSIDFAIATMMLLFAIVVIFAYGNNTFYPPRRTAQDIAVTFDTTGILWSDDETIKQDLANLGVSANIIVKCYNASTLDLDYQRSIYQTNPTKVYWYNMIRYHDGDLCSIEVGVAE